MSDFQRVVEFLRDIRQGPLQHVNDEITQLAAEYAKLCVQANERLRQCSTFLQQGLRSEAIHLAEESPNLLDLVSALDLPDHAAWGEFCQNNGLAVPPPLQLDRAAQLNEAYAQDQPLEHLMARHRLLALSRAPVRDRLETLRSIAEIDATNITWEKDIRVFEQARLKELPAAFYSAVKSRNEPSLIALAHEVTQRPWLEPVPQDLVTALTDAYGRIQRASVETELRKLVEPLRDAFAARSVQECQALVQRWRNIMAQGGVTTVAADLQDEIAPVVAFVAEQTQRDEKLRRFRESCKAFSAMLSSTMSDGQLEAAYAKLREFHEEIPEELAHQFSERKNASRQAVERGHRTKLMIIGGAAAIVIVMGLVVAWLVMQSNAGATAAARIEASVRAHDRTQMEAAAKYLDALRQSNSGLLKEPRLAAAISSLQALQTEYETDAATVQALVQKMAAARQSAAPVVADAAASLDRVGAAGGALQAVLNEAGAAKQIAWADSDGHLVAARQSVEQDLGVLAGRTTTAASAELDQITTALGAVPERIGSPAAAAEARTRLAALSERADRLQHIPLLDDATQARVAALVQQLADRRQATDALRTVAEELDSLRTKASSPASLKAALDAFIKRFPNDPRSQEFAQAEARLAAAPAIAAWQQVLVSFQGAYTVGTLQAAQRRLDAVSSYAAAHPESPLVGPGGPVTDYIAYLKAATEALGPKGSWQTAYGDLMSTPLLSELGVMTVSDGRRYFTLGDVKRTERRINDRVSVTFEALDLKDMTKRVLVIVDPPLTVSEKPTAAPHTRFMTDMAEQLKRVSDNWDFFGIDVADRIVKNSDIDPVVRAILLVPALKTEQALTGGMLGDTYERTLADLARQDAEQMPWLDISKISETTRKTLTQIMADMPPAEAVKQKLSTARAALFKRLAIHETAVGVLLKDERDAWQIGGPKVPTDTAIVWTLGPSPAAAPPADPAATTPAAPAVAEPGSLIRIGTLDRGTFTPDSEAIRNVPQGSIVYFTKP